MIAPPYFLNQRIILRTALRGVFQQTASDQVIVDSYFGQRGYQVEQFKFSNGVTWDEAAIKERVITVGTAFNDSIRGYDDGTNRIYGFDGNDVLYGGALADVIDGGNGNDEIAGVAGDDTLLGQVGDDILRAGIGNDGLTGGSGNDYLFGEAGNDTLDGGAGTDYLDGGTEIDTASYVSATVGVTVKEGLIYSPLVMCYEEYSTEREPRACTNRPLPKSHSNSIANPLAVSGFSTT